MVALRQLLGAFQASVGLRSIRQLVKEGIDNTDPDRHAYATAGAVKLEATLCRSFAFGNAIV
jgi:hypothetical protein